jgi:type III secretory pathway lipoprotein EscJ
MDKTTQDLIEEIRQLRIELKHMQEVVNSLVNIVMDMDDGQEEYDALPANQRFLDMYN